MRAAVARLHRQVRAGGGTSRQAQREVPRAPGTEESWLVEAQRSAGGRAWSHRLGVFTKVYPNPRCSSFVATSP